MQLATELKKLEERTSEQLLRHLIDSVPAFISYIDSEQKYILANALYTTFFGQEFDQIVGQHVSEVLGDKTYQKTRPHIEAALRGERQSYEYELLHNGKSRHIRAIYVPDMRDGLVKGIFVLGMDITKQKQVEQALVEQIQETNKIVSYMRNCPFVEESEVRKVCVIPELRALIGKQPYPTGATGSVTS